MLHDLTFLGWIAISPTEPCGKPTRLEQTNVIKTTFIAVEDVAGAGAGAAAGFLAAFTAFFGGIAKKAMQENVATCTRNLMGKQLRTVRECVCECVCVRLQ